MLCYPPHGPQLAKVSVKRMSVKKVTIADEFRKNSDLKEDEFGALKEWYSKQPHLPPISGELPIFVPCSVTSKLMARFSNSNAVSVKDRGNLLSGSFGSTFFKVK